jgi:hypothetical protein
MGEGHVEEGHYLWWSRGRVSMAESWEKVILGEARHRREDVVPGDAGRLWGEVRSAREEVQ